MGDGWNDICWRKELDCVTLPMPEPDTSDDSDDNDTQTDSAVLNQSNEFAIHSNTSELKETKEKEEDKMDVEEEKNENAKTKENKKMVEEKRKIEESLVGKIENPEKSEKEIEKQASQMENETEIEKMEEETEKDAIKSSNETETAKNERENDGGEERNAIKKEEKEKIEGKIEEKEKAGEKEKIGENGEKERIEEKEGDEKSKIPNCVAELLPADAYSKLVSRVYIFPGAQVYLMNDELDEDDNSNDDDDDSSDSPSSSSNCGNFEKDYDIYEEASNGKDTSNVKEVDEKVASTVPENFNSIVSSADVVDFSGTNFEETVASTPPVQYQYHTHRNHSHMYYSNYHFHYNSVEETQGDEISFKTSTFDHQLNECQAELQAQIQMLKEENSQTESLPVDSLKQKYVDNSTEPLTKRQKTEQDE